MTCIVGVVKNGNVYIAGDSAGVAGYDLSVRADSKVFKAHGFIYGFAGSFRLGQILRYSFTPPVYDGNEDIMAYMVNRYIPAIREVMEKQISEKTKISSPGSFLVGVKGRLFQIEGDWQVGENVAPFDAIGCGAALALGALTVLNTLNLLAPKEQLIHALKVTEKWNAGVRAPFALVDDVVVSASV